MLENQITAVIKAGRRPKKLGKLLVSIRKLYPKMRVVVGDDSPRPLTTSLAEVYMLPQDCGLAQGRNSLLRLVKTPYTLLLDDDFEFVEETRLESLAWGIDKFNLDLCAGSLILGKGKWKRWHTENTVQHFEGKMRVVNDPSLEEHGSLLIEKEPLQKLSLDPALFLVDITLNFFLAKTQFLLDLGWDNRCKIGGEHEDFFWRAKQQGSRIGYLPSVWALHHPGGDSNYEHLRDRCWVYQKIVKDFHGFRKIVVRGEGSLELIDPRKEGSS